MLKKKKKQKHRTPWIVCFVYSVHHDITLAPNQMISFGKLSDRGIHFSFQYNEKPI